MKIWLASIFLSVIIFNSIIAQADTFAPCGTGQYVHVGDSVNTMLANCGKPVNSTQILDDSTATVEKISWAYARNTMITSSSGIGINVSQGARFIVVFIEGKVDAIYVGDKTVTEYSGCGRSISQGFTMDEVRSKCGNPMMINKAEGKTNKLPQQITVYQYQFDPSVAPINISVINGAVAQIQ